MLLSLLGDLFVRSPCDVTESIAILACHILCDIDFLTFLGIFQGLFYSHAKLVIFPLLENNFPLF